MPRYYFDVFDDKVAFDETGLELANASAARKQAFALAWRMACTSDDAIALNHYVEVTDDQHRRIFGVTVREALRAANCDESATPLLPLAA